MMERYRCPTCKSTYYLEVFVTTWGDLVQYKDGNTEIDVTVANDFEWSDSSLMMCQNTDCEDRGKPQVAEYFLTEGN